MSAYAEAPNKFVGAASGIDYAYRDVGDGALPVILFQHFRGNLDNWDPALMDALASSRRVVAFDNVGVGMTTGTTPSSVARMARDALAFLSAMHFDQVDLLGFSIGSFVAQEIALLRPNILRGLILASSAPKGAPGMHGWAPDVIGAVGRPEPNPDGYLDVLFAPSPTSRRAGQEALKRMIARQQDRDRPTTWETRLAQSDAVCAWGIPNHGHLQRLCAVEVPVLVANGDSDPIILPHSATCSPVSSPARLKIYPDSAHGFLFQHHDEFASDVGRLLVVIGSRTSRDMRPMVGRPVSRLRRPWRPRRRPPAARR